MSFGVSRSASTSASAAVLLCSAPFREAPYPAASTAATISCGDAVPSTLMELVSRLTEQEVTPDTLDTAFSTRVLHAAQLIPVTVYCSISNPPLFHQFLKRREQVVNHLIVSVPNILRDTGADMVGQQLSVECIERRRHSG